MKNRSRGVAVLAFSSALIGIYCLFAAIAIITVGSAFIPEGSTHLATTFPVGAFFLGLAFVAYFLAYGFWTRKSWSRIGGLALFVAIVVGSVALSIVSTDFTSSVLPLISAVAGIWYLNRPVIKAELEGTEAPLGARVVTADGFEASVPAR